MFPQSSCKTDLHLSTEMKPLYNNCELYYVCFLQVTVILKELEHIEQRW